MWRNLSKSLLLLSLAVVLCCGVYPLALWAIGQAFFPFQANGSLLKGPDGQPWRNWADKARCHKRKVVKGSCFLRKAAAGGGSPAPP